MRQVTLVSLYGQKRGNLEQLIKMCWKMINDSKLGKVFEPYHMSQIHGTIVGMEKLIGFDNLFNANIWQASGNKVIMRYNEFLNVVTKHLPITVRFGGFDKNYKEFMSFGKTPYERSFQVKWATSKFTLIGWPHKNLNFTDKRVLWDLSGRSKITYRSFNIYQIPTTFLDRSNNSILDVKNGVLNGFLTFYHL